MSYCTVEKYMQTMASFMGNDNQACRKLFKGKRGTGLLFNDGSIFVQVKLSDKAPSLGYVRLRCLDMKAAAILCTKMTESIKIMIRKKIIGF